ncbi:MAG: MFS transporter [Bryobacteraceae bacterium]
MVDSSRPPANGATLLVLFLVNVLNFYDRQALGAVLEPLRREFHLSDAQLGGLTTAFTLLYAVAGLPLGRLADTGSRRKLLAAGVAVWACLTGLGGLARNYASLAVTRLGVGVGEAVCAPAATSWLAGLFPAARRTRAMAWFMMAVPVGGFLSFSVGGPVAQAFGWRVALAVAAVPGVLLVPALLLLREPRVGPDAETSAAKSTVSPWRLLRIPAFGWIAVSGAIVNFALYSFSTFLPAMLTRYHGLTIARAGVWTGVGSGVSGVLGALAAGALGDRRVDRAGSLLAARRLRLAAATALVAAPAAFAGTLVPAGSVAASVVLLMSAYGLLQTYYGLVYAAIEDIVPVHLRGAAMAAYYMAMYLCGASFGPLATGKLSDWLAGRAVATGSALEAARATGLHQAMYIIPVLALALALVLWQASRTVPEET